MKFVLSALVVLLAAMTCPQLEASSVLPACGTDSLAHYETSAGCVLGGGNGGVLVFSGFTFSVNNPDGAPVLDATEIQLAPVSSGLGGSFTFSTTGGPGFAVPAEDTITYDIFDSFVIDPGPVVSGASLHGDPPKGNVVVTESICPDSHFVTNEYECLGGPNGATYSDPQSLAIGTLPPYSLDASILLDPPAFIYGEVETEFDLTGGTTTPSTLDALTSSDTVYVAPEPVTTLLCLGGLIAIGIFRRRLMT